MSKMPVMVWAAAYERKTRPIIPLYLRIVRIDSAARSKQGRASPLMLRRASPPMLRRASQLARDLPILLKVCVMTVRAWHR